MKIHVGQIYIEEGAYYPFTYHFQNYVSEELTKRVLPSELFIQKYAEDFALMFNMSAKAALVEPDIKGPTVFRKDKDVEYSIFLTFDKTATMGTDLYRKVLKQLLEQIVVVLERLEMDASKVIEDADAIIETIVTTPKMIEEKYR